MKEPESERERGRFSVGDECEWLFIGFGVRLFVWCVFGEPGCQVFSFLVRSFWSCIRGSDRRPKMQLKTTNAASSSGARS